MPANAPPPTGNVTHSSRADVNPEAPTVKPKEPLSDELLSQLCGSLMNLRRRPVRYRCRHFETRRSHVQNLSPNGTVPDLDTRRESADSVAHTTKKARLFQKKNRAQSDR